MHLVNYENAVGDKAKALAAIKVSEAKNSKVMAWNWAKTALKYAEALGITVDLAPGRYPGMEELETALKGAVD